MTSLHLCAICIEPIASEPCTTKCHHAFHSSCLLQAALHDPRCPICRTELAQAPQTPPSTRIVNIDFSVNEWQTTMMEEAHQARRERANYAARRRRFLQRRPELQREEAAVGGLLRAVQEIECEINSEWSRQSRELWMGEPFSDLKHRRGLLLRRIRRRERFIDAETRQAIGAPPSSDEQIGAPSLLETIMRLRRENATSVPDDRESTQTEAALPQRDGGGTEGEAEGRRDADDDAIENGGSPPSAPPSFASAPARRGRRLGGDDLSAAANIAGRTRAARRRREPYRRDSALGA